MPNKKELEKYKFDRMAEEAIASAELAGANNTWIERFEKKFNCCTEFGGFHSCVLLKDENEQESLQKRIKQFISELLEEQKTLVKKEVIDEVKKSLPEESKSILTDDEIKNSCNNLWDKGFNQCLNEILEKIAK